MAYPGTYKKIDIFYKLKNGSKMYISSTNSYKTCKDAVSGIKNTLKNYPQTSRAIKRQIGEKIIYNNFSANFDKR